MPDNNNLTRLLSQIGRGDQSAVQKITPIIIDELHRLARRYMRDENAGHTLQATALVNEAWLQLIEMDTQWQNRAHFYAIAARQMRHILIDHARSKSSIKHGGGLIRVDLDVALETTSDHLTDLIALDQLLKQLESFDARASRLFEMRLFSGLSNSEIASVEQISIATVERDIRSARAWIQQALENN